MSTEIHNVSTEKSTFIGAPADPDLDQLMVVRTGEGGNFSSWAESLVDLPAGSLFARITGVTVKPSATWSTVQAGRDHHIELNSNLVFLNHSCAPTLECDMERMEMRVVGDRGLKKGDLLTFFYPSTEWIMAQPFDCWCGAGEGKGKCIGRVEGAAKMDPKRLREYFINEHIKEMLEKGVNGGKQ